MTDAFHCDNTFILVPNAGSQVKASELVRFILLFYSSLLFNLSAVEIGELATITVNVWLNQNAKCFQFFRALIFDSEKFRLMMVATMTGLSHRFCLPKLQPIPDIMHHAIYALYFNYITILVLRFFYRITASLWSKNVHDFKLENSLSDCLFLWINAMVNALTHSNCDSIQFYASNWKSCCVIFGKFIRERFNCYCLVFRERWVAALWLQHAGSFWTVFKIMDAI